MCRQCGVLKDVPSVWCAKGCSALPGGGYQVTVLAQVALLTDWAIVPLDEALDAPLEPDACLITRQHELVGRGQRH
jgi:hypothetical protein